MPFLGGLDFICRNFKIEDVRTACVDDLRLAVLTNAFEIISIALVHMAVRHQFRCVFVDDVQKGFKSSV